LVSILTGYSANNHFGVAAFSGIDDVTYDPYPSLASSAAKVGNEPKLPDVAMFSNGGNVGESGRRKIARYAYI
jgi:hypothetical protein